MVSSNVSHIGTLDSMKQSPCSACQWFQRAIVYMSKDNRGDYVSFLYVDDILLAGNNIEMIKVILYL